MKIQIKKCSDSQMWYVKLVGKEFAVVRIDSEGYWCREPAGYLNVVRREDAREIKDEI